MRVVYRRRSLENTSTRRRIKILGFFIFYGTAIATLYILVKIFIY